MLIKVFLCPEEGGFYVYVPSLHGVVSEGNTEEEALHNIKEALDLALTTYRYLGKDIPWGDTYCDEIPVDVIEKWVSIR